MTTSRRVCRCPECGNDVVLLGGKGRTACIRRGGVLVDAPIPDDYEIPTCVKCGENVTGPEHEEPLYLMLGDDGAVAAHQAKQ